MTGEGREDILEDEGGWSSESVFEITNTFQKSNIDNFQNNFYYNILKNIFHIDI